MCELNVCPESCEGSGTEQPGEEEEEEEDSVMEDGEAEEHNAAAEESHKPEDIVRVIESM